MIKKITTAALLIGGTAFAQVQGGPGYPSYNSNPAYNGDPAYQSGPYSAAPYDNSGAYDPGQDGYAAPAPPPPPAYAYQPPAPGPGYVWIAGFWNFAGGRYVWTNGYWTLPPYAGGYWIAPRYYGGRFYTGHWGGVNYGNGDRREGAREYDRGRPNFHGGEERREERDHRR